jgi:hypothetical protein
MPRGSSYLNSLRIRHNYSLPPGHLELDTPSRVVDIYYNNLHPTTRTTYHPHTQCAPLDPPKKKSRENKKEDAKSCMTHSAKTSLELKATPFHHTLYLLCSGMPPEALRHQDSSTFTNLSFYPVFICRLRSHWRTNTRTQSVEFLKVKGERGKRSCRKDRKAWLLAQEFLLRSSSSRWIWRIASCVLLSS